jgi:hypothetical protein
VLLETLQVDVHAFAARTGWDIKPEGLCQGDLCIPLPDGAVIDGAVNVEAVAERAGMPLVVDDKHGLWALGPATAATGRALSTAVAPELELPDLRTGERFRLSSLRGKKVLLLAWASW